MYVEYQRLVTQYGASEANVEKINTWRIRQEAKIAATKPIVVTPNVTTAPVSDSLLFYCKESLFVDSQIEKLVQEMSKQLLELTEKVKVLEERVSVPFSAGPVALTVTVTGLPPFVSKEDVVLRMSVEKEKTVEVIVKVLEIMKGKGLKLARKEDFGLYLQISKEKRAEIDLEEVLAKAIRSDERDSIVVIYKKK